MCWRVLRHTPATNSRSHLLQYSWNNAVFNLVFSRTVFSTTPDLVFNLVFSRRDGGTGKVPFRTFFASFCTFLEGKNFFQSPTGKGARLDNYGRKLLSNSFQLGTFWKVIFLTNLAPFSSPSVNSALYYSVLTCLQGLYLIHNMELCSDRVMQWCNNVLLYCTVL